MEAAVKAKFFSTLLRFYETVLCRPGLRTNCRVSEVTGGGVTGSCLSPGRFLCRSTPSQPPAPGTQPVDPAKSGVGLRIIYKCSQGKRVPVSFCYRNEPGPAPATWGATTQGCRGVQQRGLSTRYQSKKMSDLLHRGVRYSREEGWRGRRGGCGHGER